MSLKITFAAGAALAAACAPAFADDFLIRRDGEFLVSYGDLDLSAAAGQDELARRVDFTIARFCRRTAHRALQQITSCERAHAADFAERMSGDVRAAMLAAERRRTGRDGYAAAE